MARFYSVDASLAVLHVLGATMFEKMCHLRQHGDDLHKLMLREKHGYPALCCNEIVPPTRPEADAGYVIMGQVENPGMSGTNTICVATVRETGVIPMSEPVTGFAVDAPAGLIGIRAECEAGEVKQITFRFRKSGWKKTHYFLYLTGQSAGHPTDPHHDYRLTWLDLDGALPMFWPDQRELIGSNRERIRELVEQATG